MQVNSSNIADVEWADGILTVAFVSGGKYQYFDVPQGIFQELLGAPSPGQYFHQFIKGLFEYERIG